MCLEATITPFSNSTSPAGPTSLSPGVPSISPDSLIGAFTPRGKQSAKDTSTWVSGLAGPNTLTVNFPFGPTKSTFSSQAYWPGWERSLNLQSAKDTSTWVSGLAGPNTLTVNFPFGPTKSTFSSQAYWPGWERSLNLTNSWPLNLHL